MGEAWSLVLRDGAQSLPGTSVDLVLSRSDEVTSKVRCCRARTGPEEAGSEANLSACEEAGSSGCQGPRAEVLNVYTVSLFNNQPTQELWLPTAQPPTAAEASGGPRL